MAAGEQKSPMVTLALPIDPYDWAYLTMPRTISAAMWEQMMTVLEAMKPGIVEVVDAPFTPGQYRAARGILPRHPDAPSVTETIRKLRGDE